MATTLEARMRLMLDALMAVDYGITDNKAIANIAVQYDSEDLDETDADKIFHQSGTIGDGLTLDFDLLTELDPVGAALSLSSVTLLVVKNTTASGGAGLFVGDGTGVLPNAWTACFGPADSVVYLPPGGAFFYPCPEGLTVDAAHKVLRLEHDGVGVADVSYEVVILGLD